MILCDKNNRCVAGNANQQKCCAEALPDHPFGPMCQWWNYPDKCGIGHLIDDDKKREPKAT